MPLARMCNIVQAEPVACRARGAVDEAVARLADFAISRPLGRFSTEEAGLGRL